MQGRRSVMRHISLPPTVGLSLNAAQRVVKRSRSWQILRGKFILSTYPRLAIEMGTESMPSARRRLGIGCLKWPLSGNTWCPTARLPWPSPERRVEQVLPLPAVLQLVLLDGRLPFFQRGIRQQVPILLGDRQCPEAVTVFLRAPRSPMKPASFIARSPNSYTATVVGYRPEDHAQPSFARPFHLAPQRRCRFASIRSLTPCGSGSSPAVAGGRRGAHGRDPALQQCHVDGPVRALNWSAHPSTNIM